MIKDLSVRNRHQVRCWYKSIWLSHNKLAGVRTGRGINCNLAADNKAVDVLLCAGTTAHHTASLIPKI
jgi:hypothetical protein